MAKEKAHKQKGAHEGVEKRAQGVIFMKKELVKKAGYALKKVSGKVKGKVANKDALKAANEVVKKVQRSIKRMKKKVKKISKTEKGAEKKLKKLEKRRAKAIPVREKVEEEQAIYDEKNFKVASKREKDHKVHEIAQDKAKYIISQAEEKMHHLQNDLQVGRAKDKRRQAQLARLVVKAKGQRERVELTSKTEQKRLASMDPGDAPKRLAAELKRAKQAVLDTKVALGNYKA